MKCSRGQLRTNAACCARENARLRFQFRTAFTVQRLRLMFVAQSSVHVIATHLARHGDSTGQALQKANIQCMYCRACKRVRIYQATDVLFHSILIHCATIPFPLHPLPPFPLQPPPLPVLSKCITQLSEILDRHILNIRHTKLGYFWNWKSWDSLTLRLLTWDILGLRHLGFGTIWSLDISVSDKSVLGHFELRILWICTFFLFNFCLFVC